MAATGEKTYDWSGADQDPYVHPDFNILNQPAEILNGGLRDTLNFGGPTKVVYNGAVNRTVDIVSRVEFQEGGVLWSDPRGPSLTDPDTGAGYWMRVNGNQLDVHKQTSETDSGSKIRDTITIASLPAGAIYGIGINPAGLITLTQDGVTLGFVTDSTYLSTVAPGAQVEYANTSSTSLASIGMDGVAEDVAIPPSWTSTPSPPPATQGTPYLYDFSSLLEGTQPITVTEVGARLPAGLNTTNTTIEGTPTIPGTSLGLRMRATGAEPAADSEDFELQVNAVGVVAPAIDDVNTNNTFTSESAGVIHGSGFTGAFAVSVGGWLLTFEVVSDTEITYEELDLHDTSVSPGNPEPVDVVTGGGTARLTVALIPRAGNLYLTALFIDEDPTQIGLLGTTSTPAVTGDGYEGVKAMAGSTLVYDPYGPHRDIQPAVWNGHSSTGWHYSAANQTWERIDEITNQTSTPNANLTDPYHAVTDTTIGVTFTTNTGRGTAYIVATLTNEAPTPTAEEIKAGVGESSVSFVVDATGAQEPAYLAGLDPTTRYWYWIVQDTDGLNTFSNIISGTALTTSTPVGVPDPAILTDPFEGVSGGTFGSVGVTSSSSLGMLYFVAMLDPDEPSDNDIKYGVGAASHSSAIPKVGVNGPYLLDGLDPTQLYYYWFVQDTNTDRSGEG